LEYLATLGELVDGRAARQLSARITDREVA
jgi:hypothetical protein